MKAFLEEVADDIYARFGAGLQHCALVFNNKRPADYIKKYLADLHGKPFWSPAFLTIQEFVRSSSSMQVADAHTQLFTLYDSYIRLLKKEGETLLPGLANFQNMARIILSDFSQIDMELGDAGKIFSDLEDIAQINATFDFLTEEQKGFLSRFWTTYNEGKQKAMQQKFIAMWRRMPQLYAGFHAQLADQGLMSTAKLYRQLAEEKHDQPDFTAPYQEGKILFIGFNALNGAEEKIFKRLQDRGEALFYFDTDRYYLDDELQEAGFFIRRNLKSLGLHNQLSNERCFLPPAHPAKGDVDNLSASSPKPRSVKVYRVQGDTAQAKIVHHILQEKYPQISAETGVSSTAIILANENLLIPVLQSIPEQANGQAIPLNVTMGMPLSSSTLAGLAEIWLDVQAHYQYTGKKTIAYQAINAFLSHPLTGISEKLKETVANALIEQQLREVPQEKMLQFKGLLFTFFSEVATPGDTVKGLIAIFDEIWRREIAAKRLKVIESQLFMAAMKELNRLHDNLQDHLARYANEVLDPGFLASLILKSLQSVSAALEGEATRGLQLMGLLESRSLDFSHILILGANEGMLPKGRPAATFIPEPLRRAYNLPLPAYQDAISAYMFYRLLQRAEKIDIVYNGITDENNSGEKSRFITQLQYESAFNFKEKEDELPLQTEHKMPLEIPKTPEIQARLNQYLSGRVPLSATALTTYIANPVDFFYRYVAGIKEPKIVEETVEADKLGLILHKVMEYFYGELKEKQALITADDIAEKAKELDSLVQRAFAQEIYGSPQLPAPYSGMQKVIVAIVKEYVQLILEEDRTQAPFRIIEVEDKGAIAHSFKTADGRPQSIKLFGIIDRLEEKEGVYRLVDYKTGADSLKFTTLAGCFDHDSNKLNKALVQTLFYKYVSEQRYGLRDVEVALYVVRNMKKEGVHFKSKAGGLSAAALTQASEEFITLLNQTLAELFDYTIPFRVSARPENYTYSIYKTLFNG